MARISAFDRGSGGVLEVRRAAVTLVVLAAHVALVIVMWRSVWRSAEDAEITFVALPIDTEDRRREPVQKQPISRPAQVVPQHSSAARPSVSAQAHGEPSPEDSSRREIEASDNNVATPAGSASEPAPRIDWHAEARASVDTLEQRDSLERDRRSFAGPKQHMPGDSHQTPACPFQKCEPDWGKHFGVFESLRSKGGRIETVPYDISATQPGNIGGKAEETIRWYNNRCYEILVSPDPKRRGMKKCVVPLGKKVVRGDLFDHMHESPPPEPHATDVP